MHFLGPSAFSLFHIIDARDRLWLRVIACGSCGVCGKRCGHYEFVVRIFEEEIKIQVAIILSGQCNSFE